MQIAILRMKQEREKVGMECDVHILVNLSTQYVYIDASEKVINVPSAVDSTLVSANITEEPKIGNRPWLVQNNVSVNCYQCYLKCNISYILSKKEAQPEDGERQKEQGGEGHGQGY
jgi:hypothetical protein